MKNALSTLLPLVLLCVGSVLLNVVAVWAAETPLGHAHISLDHPAATVMRVAQGVDANHLLSSAAGRARGHDQGH